MNAKIRKRQSKRKAREREKQLAARRAKIARRLDPSRNNEDRGPVFAAGACRFELADRIRGIDCGGIGLLHSMTRKIGLAEAIDERLSLLKIHRPYHESDHVLNIAYNILCGGTCLDDIERRRNDEVFLDALDVVRIPDPTTAGDFCRRFSAEDVLELHEAFDQARRKVWAEQPAEFFEQAIIDLDGTLVPTTGECKQGMEYSYKKVWGYHPLLVSLANTNEPLRIINRMGNRPSHEGAWAEADNCIELCRDGGFRKILLRGDTDFTQTEYLDRWDQDGVQFVFGVDSMPNLCDLADKLPKGSWKVLHRREKRPLKGKPRAKPENVKQQIVKEREFENIRLRHEDIAEFDYRPGKCDRAYRMVVVRKNLTIEKGETALIDEVRYYFFITNDLESPIEQIVFQSNDRCNQENVIEQLKNGAQALRAPLGDLNSNWAYMVIASLAWQLKAWAALIVPEPPGRWRQRRREEKRTLLRMEFKRFIANFIQIPCQIVRQGRRLIYRMLSWNPWRPTFFRLVDVLQC